MFFNFFFFWPNEEILFDSDDEPDYLLDVVNSTMNEFKSLDENEIDRRLLLAGISPGIGIDSSSTENSNQEIIQTLFAKLNSDEQKSFKRLANEMLNLDQVNTSCFKKKANKKV